MSSSATDREEEAPEAPPRQGDDDLVSVKVISPNVMVERDLLDPAILLVGPANNPNKPPKYVYSYDVLIKLRQSPFSTKRPDYLDTAHDNNGTWDPERWHMERKAAETPAENGNRNGNGGGNSTDLENHRRRSGDPKDRLRREHDGIVLSPQRRSFNSGCFVPVREPTRSNRPHSPLVGKGGDAPGHMGHREISQGPPTRRIGSGRILPWDYQEKNDIDNDFGYRRERRDTDRDDRFDRRSFGRDEPSGPRQPKGPKDVPGPFNRNNNRYDRRRVSENKEEEPEWFSEGPISQHDTIELRGFDDADKINKKKPGNQKKKARDKERSINRANGSQKAGETTDMGIVKASAKEDLSQEGEKEVPQADKSSSGGNKDTQKPIQIDSKKHDSEDKEFNLDDFLQSDIPSILRNGIENQSSGSSKFSQWFKRESPPVINSNQSRGSSMEDDQNHVINTILNDITESTVNIPGDADSYFAPISPAANTAPPGPSSQAFIEMLHKTKQQQHQRNPQAKNIDITGKMFVLEELEAKIRKPEMGAGDMRAAHQNVTSDSSADDNAAFKKLLAQVNAGNLSLASNGPTKAAPMSLMEMLSHSQKQDEAARMAQMMSGDLSYKFQQQQQQQHQPSQQQRQQQMDVLAKFINAQMRHAARTSPPLNDLQVASRELLNRPEAQAIFQGLKRGDITPQNLYQQLANPAMQSRHRELLQMILKTLPAGMGPSPRVLSPMAPQHAAYAPQQQQQQLRVSPLPPNALHQRIPSPRELQLHTQHIMHNALIKKKLEEQSENFRKKQESQQRAQQSVSGSIPPAKNVTSPTQLAWGTPTSVLRKMTADKDDGKDANKNDPSKGRAVTGMRTQPTPQQQWNSQFPMNKQGRPIVKNNANYQQQVQQQHHDQYLLQQRIFNQQQQQQQRKQNQQFANMQYGGVPQQFGQTQFNQHQLRAQHQARAQHQHQAQPQQQPQQQQQSQQFGQHQWMLQNQNFDNRQGSGNRSGTSDGGDMSPTSNQLARWFSSDLLDRARKGKLPTMPPNLAQHALSLEEIERQATPAVHN